MLLESYFKRLKVKGDKVNFAYYQIKYKNLEKYCLIDFQTNVSEFGYGPLV